LPMQSCVGCVSLSRLSVTKEKHMEDYAQAFLDIKALRAQAYEAMQEHRWSDACELADKIVIAAHKVKMYCLFQPEQENANEQ